MEAQYTIGKISPNIEGRDAIHVAVLAVTAKEELFAGQWASADGTASGNTIGVVDPFLSRRVLPGEKFWLCITPRTVQSMTHNWTHIDLDYMNPEPKESKETEIPKDRTHAESMAWIENYASQLPVHEDDLLLAAAKYLDRQEYWNEGELFEGIVLDPEFWEHYEVVNGIIIPEHLRNNFFTCSC